ncbi:hypothetical protein [Shewanella gaetbuli]|uniref:Uncharacterized protein n=1 Tax=Shewanella gaetbuli TaxID=220752 RepID=A0A9X2CK04_9GAMM|nr:hypothetical protein [Shewanella gaetbuli]MCL1141170.1 hypothetical protein [Shewanella gaetbuli]
MPQTPRPAAITFLIVLYSIFTAIALYRVVQFSAFDILSLAVIPVLIGLVIKAKWTKVALFFHLGLQTLVFLALSSTALIAYQITPEDVKLEFGGYNIPVLPVAGLSLLLLCTQWWAALTYHSRQYLK